MGFDNIPGNNRADRLINQLRGLAGLYAVPGFWIMFELRQSGAIMIRFGPPPRPILAMLCWAGMLAVSVGFVYHQFWAAVPWSRAAEYGMGASLLAVISMALAYVLRLSFASVCAASLLVLLSWFTGPFSVLATFLLLLAALGVGSWLVPRCHPGRFMLAAVCGLACLAALVGWTLMFPVHGRLTYLSVLISTIIIRRRAILELCASVIAGWRSSGSGVKWESGFALIVLGIASATTWLPTFQYDDIAYHLALPWQLQHLGYYRLDAASNVWALAPWASDVLHAVVQVVSGVESRGVVNALWLGISAALIWRLAEGVGLSPGLRWMSIALYASQPVTASLLATMQTETPAVAGLLALALAIQRAPDRPDPASLCLTGVLAAFLMSLKVSMVLALVPTGLWLLWRWRGSMPWRALPIALALALVVAGHSYAYAYYVGDNPVLPLFNGIFNSQYFDAHNFKGTHWESGFGIALPWEIVFSTSRYLEARDGAAGFFPIALAGAVLVTLLEGKARALALVGIACFLLPLSQLQYLRYAHPATALLIIAALAGLQAAISTRLSTFICIVLCVANVMFIANSRWSLLNGGLRTMIEEGDLAVLETYAPERIANAYLKGLTPNGILVLYPQPGAPFAAELGGRGLVTNWYDLELSRIRPIAEADETGDGWLAVFAKTGATHVVVRRPKATPAIVAALKKGAVLEETVGPLDIWRVEQPTSTGFMAKRDIAKRIMPR